MGLYCIALNFIYFLYFYTILTRIYFLFFLIRDITTGWVLFESWSLVPLGVVDTVSVLGDVNEDDDKRLLFSSLRVDIAIVF